MKFRIAFVFFLLVVFSSCTTGRLLTEADRAFERGEYYAALEKYKLVSPKEKDTRKKAQLTLRMAEAYMAQGSYLQAAIWYKNAIRRGNNSANVRLSYGDALRAGEKPDELDLLLNELKKTNPDDPKLKNNIESLKLIRHWQKLPPIYLIENLKAPNSSGDELSAALLPGKTSHIMFSSSSENASGKDTSPVTGQKFADIFVAGYDSVRSRWLLPQLLGDSLKINTEAHESGITIDQEGKLVVFARATYINGQKMISRLYFCKKENEKWAAPEPIFFTNDGATYEDPSISADGKWLLFASDRVGGLGKTDIWKSEINDGQFSEPVNLGGQINTPGRELGPYRKKNGHLYFSSDYHPGAGGLDIFRATVDLNGKWTVENMSTPVNSPADDFGIVFYDRGERGFFSSSRKGSRRTDLYSFYSPPRLFQCFGKVCNTETDSVIDNVNVRVVGTDGTSLLMKTEKGKFRVDLKPETDYAIMVFKKGYLNAQAKISTRGLRDAFEFNLDFLQTPTDQPIAIDDIYYETGKWDLLPESLVSLDKLVEVLTINPDISVEIMSHTDDVGDAVFNMELSQKRADEVVRYLVRKGIAAGRLKAKGYGESLPLKVRLKTTRKYRFLKEGDILGIRYIEQLSSLQQDIARSLNRRTEFQVLE
ncbi:MAG: OmpA family protein [Prolixibacteraceae bacterium]|jgi:peptidoglycan-associated lipoprotein|nr:OmpA family protein [Prolixibacteraceae bacterium]